MSLHNRRQLFVIALVIACAVCVGMGAGAWFGWATLFGLWAIGGYIEQAVLSMVGHL